MNLISRETRVTKESNYSVPVWLVIV